MDSPGRGKQKRIRPLSPREFCLLLFQKALEMIDQSEFINWTNIRWISAADILTFEEVNEWFQKKYPADWFRGAKACKDIPGKNNILHQEPMMTYIMLKKILHRYMSGKNF